jgi:hypothetical protein
MWIASGRNRCGLNFNPDNPLGNPISLPLLQRGGVVIAQIRSHGFKVIEIPFDKLKANGFI